MNSSTTFSVAKEFSRFPGGRKISHGPFSGELFRKNVTLRLLAEFDQITFDLQGSKGYSTGFLDEAFGEIGRLIGLEEALRRIKFISTDDPQAEITCWARIREAGSERLRK